MITQYTYHSTHHHSSTDRWRHFLLYVGALLLLVAAGRSFWLYFTHWTDGQDHSHWWQLGLGILYLLVGMGLAYAAYHHESLPTEDVDRYARIQDNVLTYNLDQVSGEQSLDLSNIQTALRRNIRELEVKMKDGSEVIIPVYLICNEEKQRELVGIISR